MSIPPTPRDHALRVSVLGALLDVVKSEYEAARKAAEPEFAVMRAEGQKQQAVMLPDGTEIGLVSIKAGAPTVEVTEGALEGWVREHVPDGMEDYIVPAALADAEVLDMLKACFPSAVRQRIRPATRAALLKEIADSDGKVADKVSGEVEQLGKVEQHKPTGAFSYRSAPGARDRIVAEWRAGRLTEIAFGPLALPQRMEPDPAAYADTTPFGAEYADEDGFLDPEHAAMHALAAHGRHITPPVAAYQMLREGGTHAERARTWLAAHGLPLDDLDIEAGRDIPWPPPVADGDAEGAASVQDVPPAPEKPLFGPPFCDEHGFKDPVLAAAHALMVQDGFTTPPVEAYRMIRDGGVGAERSRAWLEEVGLDPADPREGKDTPWPLPDGGTPGGE